MLRVHFHAAFRRVTGARLVEFDLPPGTTAQELLDAAAARFPGLVGKLVDDHGRMRGRVHLFVNGRGVVLLRDRLQTILREDDTIHIFPSA